MTDIDSIMDALIGSQQVEWSNHETVLSWRYHVPAWGWALIVLASVVLAAWSYRHLAGPSPAKVLLATTRTVLLITLAVLLAGPMLVLTQEQIDPDWLVMLVDRSASMTVKDMARTKETAGLPSSLISRDEALRHALAQNQGIFDPGLLGSDRRVLWLGFDASVYEIESPAADPDRLPNAGGQVTAIKSAIEQVLTRMEGRPIGGIVLVSDGQTFQNTGPELIHRLQQRATSVFAVPLGARTPLPDLNLVRIDNPKRAFVNDTVPITVWIGQSHDDDIAMPPEHVRVRLVAEPSGEILDEKHPTGGLDQPVRLTSASAIPGHVKWRVELAYDPTESFSDAEGAPRHELTTENNHQMIHVQFIDRPIRVLYVEGYPRWEYRYLKNVLIRENSTRVSTLLISADRDFAQEGDEPITRLPRDVQELREYDVVILGDVDPDYFAPQQLQLIRDHVAREGAGLLWIGGVDQNPRRFHGTPLADLLPMRDPSATTRIDADNGPITVVPTDLATSLNVMRIETPNEGQVRDWPERLPPLFWVQNLRPLKASAETLAVGRLTDDTVLPLIVRMRYGAGQSVFVGTEETWRWRYGRGDLYFERFWVQLVRLLGRQRLERNHDQITLSVSHPRIELGQTVVVELAVNDAHWLQNPPRSVLITAKPPEPQEGKMSSRPNTGPMLFELWPTTSAADDQPSQTISRSYRAVWRPDHAGRFTLQPNIDHMIDLHIATEIEVVPPEDEFRQPAPDHQRLNTLAHQTGGSVIPLDQLGDLLSYIPNRARRTPNDLTESLWDSPLSLIAILLLLSVEWIGRKIIRLS